MDHVEQIEPALLRHVTRNLWALLSAPFVGGNPFLGDGPRFFWLYLAAALVIAAVAYRLHYVRGGPWGVRSFLAFCFPGELYRHPSAILDYKLCVANAALFPVTIVLSVVSVEVVGTGVFDAMTRILGPRAAIVEWSATAALVFTLGAILMRELTLFVGHVLMHRVPLLWEFHRVHHSAEVLTPLTNERRHPVDAALTIALVIGTAGLWQGFATYACFGPLRPHELLAPVAFSLYFERLYILAGFHLRHSHVWLSYGRLLEHVLISPAQHQIHHSVAPRHRNRNYGEALAVFDWLFGTLYIPDGREELTVGLGARPARSEYHGVLSTYLVPLARVWRHVATSRRRSARSFA